MRRSQRMQKHDEREFKESDFSKFRKTYGWNFMTNKNDKQEPLFEKALLNFDQIPFRIKARRTARSAYNNEIGILL